MRAFVSALVRKKTLSPLGVEMTELHRCLGVVDLTLLGVGSTLGAGIYVVAGQVAQDTAGPAVIISFLIAAIASFLAGICYAEFAAKVPRAGSAYVYSYVTMGEFIAFIIGWNLILEYVIGTASVARAWSAYVDSISHDHVKDFLEKYFPIHVPTLSPYFDFLAVVLTLVIMGLLAWGINGSSKVNNVFCAINLTVVATIIIAGCTKLHLSNWHLHGNVTDGNETEHEDQLTNCTTGEPGQGGFAPFGVSGIITGAATCFYAFVGFDAIATTGEEVRNPQKALPISILVCLFICFLAYFGVSAVVTLMVPYCMLDSQAPVARVFDQVGLEPLHYVVAIGALAGLSSSLLGAMIPMPRVIYAMASDGLLFKFLAYVPSRLQTPLTATIVSGVFSAVMAGLFDIRSLVEMMSIGTLLAYTIVALSVMVLRYQPLPEQEQAVTCGISEDEEGEEDEVLLPPVPHYDERPAHKLYRCFIFPPRDMPTKMSGEFVYIASILACFEVFGLCAVMVFACFHPSIGFTWWAIMLLAVFGLLLLVTLVAIARQPEQPNIETLTNGKKFQVPFVPWVPVCSIFINVYLILKLRYLTWVRFGVWMVLGLLIYFCYGIFKSKERQRRKSYRPSVNEQPALIQ